MTDEKRGIDEARTELAAARHLMMGGFQNQAISRAYYAAFYAAKEALSTVGVFRSKHSGAVSAFEKHIVHDGGFPPNDSALLRSLFRRRSLSDYGAPGATAQEAASAIEDAECFVDAVGIWLQDQD